MTRRRPRTTVKGLEQLRAAYLLLRPAQRRTIARQRLTFPDRTPNRLVNAVSATEGLARAILLERLERQGQALDEAYAAIRLVGPVELLKRLHGSGGTALVDERNWTLFKTSIKCRDFLVHEAAFVNQVDGGQMIAAVERVFEALEQLAEPGA